MSNKEAVNTANKVVEEAVEEVIERPYSLRKLKDGDLFPLLKILRKVGLSNFKDTLMVIASGKSLQEVGVVVILNIAEVVIGNLDSAEEEIYALWSDLSGLSPDEIREMEFGTLPLMIYDSFSEVKNVSFFKVLFKLL